MAETQAKEGAATRRLPGRNPRRVSFRSRSSIIGNAKADKDIVAAIAEYGYDEAKLLEGEALIARLVELSSNQRAEYGQRYDATLATTESWKKAEAPTGGRSRWRASP